MCEDQLSLVENHEVRLQDIFLRIRPEIKKLLPVFEQIEEGAVISLSGESSCGKSMLIMEIIAHVLLGGSEIEILLVDPQGNFKIFKLIEICTKLMMSENQSDQSNESSLRYIKEHFKKLHIMKEASLIPITDIIKQNRNISLVIVDSLESCYYTKSYEALEDERKPWSKEYYMFKRLSMLSNLVKKFDITVVYARPEYENNERYKFRDNITTHFVALEKGKDSFKMNIRTLRIKEKIIYSIHQNGLEILEGKKSKERRE